MSDGEHLGVEAFSISEETQEAVYVGSMFGMPAPAVFRARLDLVMNEAGKDRFLEAMEAAIPGFRRPGRQRPMAARALPERTRALPAAPVDAEFVDE